MICAKMAQKYLSDENGICVKVAQKYLSDEHSICVKVAKKYLSNEQSICGKMAQKYVSDEQKITMYKIKWILKKWDGEVWTGLLGLRLGTGGGRL
jgi:hypothetical protein